MSDEFTSKKSSITWEIEIPKTKNYIAEITYSLPQGNNQAIFYLDHEVWNEIPLTLTVNKDLFLSPRGKKKEIKKGIHRLSFEIKTLNFANINLVSVRLIPAILNAKISELRKSSLFGKTLEEMNLIYGTNITDNDKPFLMNSAGEREPELFKSMKNIVKTARWMPHLDYEMTAYFLANKTVGIKIIKRREVLNMNKIKLEVQKLLPEIKFENAPIIADKKTKGFTLYGKDTNEDYMIQFWGGNMLMVKNITSVKKRIKEGK